MWPKIVIIDNLFEIIPKWKEGIIFQNSQHGWETDCNEKVSTPVNQDCYTHGCRSWTLGKQFRSDHPKKVGVNYDKSNFLLHSREESVTKNLPLIFFFFFFFHTVKLKQSKFIEKCHCYRCYSLWHPSLYDPPIIVVCKSPGVSVQQEMAFFCNILCNMYKLFSREIVLGR